MYDITVYDTTMCMQGPILHVKHSSVNHYVYMV